MPGFADSYLGRLRAVVGSRLLLVPGTRIVIENQSGQILLQKRADFGVWGLPGGGPDEGESLQETIIREVAEETGLRISDLHPFGFSSDPSVETITYPNGDQCQIFSLMFWTRSFEGEPKVADDESLQVDWFATDALPQMLPNMRRSVEAFERYRATSEFQLI